MIIMCKEYLLQRQTAPPTCADIKDGALNCQINRLAKYVAIMLFELIQCQLFGFDNLQTVNVNSSSPLRRRCILGVEIWYLANDWVLPLEFSLPITQCLQLLLGQVVQLGSAVLCL